MEAAPPLFNYPICEMQEVTTTAAFADILNSNRSVIVDFYAEWCGPCKMIAPVLKNLSVANPEITFVKVDVDQAQQLTSKYGITAMPTFLAFSNGSQIGEVRGADKAGIEKLVASLK